MSNPKPKIYLPNNAVVRLMPELAAEIGLNESILLLQIDFWISGVDHFEEGKYWTYQSVREIKKTFPYWGVATINRTIKSLEKKGLVHVGRFNKHAYDKTRWFALNVDTIGNLKSIAVVFQNGTCVYQNGTALFQSETSPAQNGTTIPKTTPKTTPKNNTKRARKSPTKNEIFWLDWQAHDRVGRAILDAFGYDTTFKEPKRYPLKFLEPYLEAAKQLTDADTEEIAAAYRYLIAKAKRERWTVSPSPLSLAKYFPEYQRSQQHKIIPLPVEEFPLPTADPNELRARLSGESLPKVSGDYE